MPDACIGVDVIVGFPGETEKYFMDTFDFLNSLDISYLHVFSYSERDNTIAKNLANIVDKSVRFKRSKLLRSLSVKMKRKFYSTQVGSNKNILFESENKNGFIFGFSENYVRVKTPWRKNLVNSVVKYNLKEISEDGNILVENYKKLITA